MSGFRGIVSGTEGDYRIVKKSDGYYVVGYGMVTPVENKEEGEKMIEELKE